MTANDLVTKANALHDTSIDTTTDATFITNTINDFQSDVSEFLPPIGTTSNIVAADTVTWYNLPTDMIELYTDDYSNYIVTKDGVETTGLTFYFRDLYPNRQVKFSTTGTFTFRYYKTPTKITDNATSQLDMHLYLQDLGDLFLAGKYKLKEDDGVGLDLLQEYEVKRDNRISMIKTPSGQPQQIIDVYNIGGDF